MECREWSWAHRAVLLAAAVVWLPLVFADCFGHQPLQESMVAVRTSAKLSVQQVLLIPVLP